MSWLWNIAQIILSIWIKFIWSRLMIYSVKKGRFCFLIFHLFCYFITGWIWLTFFSCSICRYLWNSQFFFIIVKWIFRYEESAMIYAQTGSSFEDIALKFLADKQINALKIFLRKVFIYYLHCCCVFDGYSAPPLL